MLRGVHGFPWRILAAVEILRFVHLLPTKDEWNRFSYSNPFQTTAINWCWRYRTQRSLSRNALRINELRNVLEHFTVAMECRDPRDRIFGLLGIARDATELGIEADYSKSFEDVL